MRVTNEVYHSTVSLGALAPQLCHLLPDDTAQPPSSPPPYPASSTNGSVSESLLASFESVSDFSSASSEAALVP